MLSLHCSYIPCQNLNILIEACRSLGNMEMNYLPGEDNFVWSIAITAVVLCQIGMNVKAFLIRSC